MTKRTFRLLTLALTVCALGSACARGGQADALLARIKAVGAEGAGNPDAAKAWKELVRLEPTVLPEILTAMDGTDVTASNYLRAAVDAVAERAVRDGKTLPTKELEAFLADKRHAGPARRLAYEWLARVDKTAPARLLPGMIQDTSNELRRDAVAVALKDAKGLLDKGDKGAATAAYRKALSGACDQDQVDDAVKQLKELGVEIDVAAHFGFIRKWKLAAPFDNTDETGFKAVFPPEKGVDLKAVYKGKGEAEVRWVEHTTADRYGIMDLNKTLGKKKAATVYAHAAIEVPAAGTVQVRAGSMNGLKIFVNGKEVFAREEYHHGMRMDQYAVPVALKAGRNELLVKICQNNQEEDWAQQWQFQLRLCDEAGAAVAWKPVEDKQGARPEKGVGQ
jgi:hypothetical protein